LDSVKDDRSPSFDWRQHKVVVTGAGGFIGSHLVSKLLQNGAKVRAFTHYNSRGDIGHLQYIPKELRTSLEVVAGDLRDHRAVDEVVRGAGTVFHLGALIGIPYSYVNPIDVAQTNLLGTLNILNACRDAEVRRLIQTSTSEVYGTARYTPIDEAHPLQAQSPYAATKIGGDKLAESYYNTFGLPVTTVRPFNTYGPCQSARAVIPTIIMQVLNSDAVHLGSTETRRDFTYVHDTRDGFIAAAESPDTIGEVVNLGTGIDVSIGDVVDCVFQITERPLPVILDDKRVRPAMSEVLRLISNNAKAGQLAGWRPRVSLEEGLRQTVEWVAGHPELYRPAQYAI
jgi:dTDP-glucose 4,6-dehydratase